jgi:hypothetical protein
MARSLGVWSLPVNTDWLDEHNGWSPIRQSKRRTVGGGLAVASQVLSGGRPITLEWARGRQWLTYADMLQIQTLLDAGATSSYTFIWDGFSAIVRVDFERQAREVSQRGWRLNPSDDKFYGSLFLYTV